MQEWIVNNYKWIFSGVGVFIISLILTKLTKKRRNQNLQENTGGKMNNNVNARNVNINQTIVSNVANDPKASPKEAQRSDKSDDKEIQRIKERYAKIGKQVRTTLVKKLENARNTNSEVKVHNITDYMEEKYGLPHEVITSELERLEEDGLINLITYGNNTISPYTEIRVGSPRLFDVV